MTINKNHWYDGRFYDKLIAPNQDNLFEQINDLIETNSKVIDIGCGTGRLEFKLATKCQSVTGIDLSKRNIDRAQQNLEILPDDKISFQHASVSEIMKGQQRFDYAVLTYVIHEVNDEDRIKLLKDIATIADKIIIGDYLVPRPTGFWSNLTEVIEFVAGVEHYRNFKIYVANGGLLYLANKAGLKISMELKNFPINNHIVVLTT
jgi:2-polyprenyl-3-methyl-5-hydroxy-6-metoxy-1,4-benzoquinol methylase